MKKFFSLCLLSCLFCIGWSLPSLAQSIDVQFVESPNSDCTDDLACFIIQVRSTDGGDFLGNSSIRFSYDDSVIFFDGFHLTGINNGTYTELGFYNDGSCPNPAIYDVNHAFDGSFAGDFLLTIVLNESTFGFPCTDLSDNQWYDVSEICFDILDFTGNPNLQFTGVENGFPIVSNTDETNFNDGTNDPINKYDNGTFGDFTTPLNQSCICGTVGCTDPNFCEYDPNAVCDDGCLTPNTDPGTCNTDCTQGNIEAWNMATCQCDIVTVTVSGCTDATACNYNPSANCDNGSCNLPDGCTNAAACNYNASATCDDGSCVLPDGCTDATACNYDPTAACDNGSCILPDGCTDATACNYNAAALCDDGSCVPAPCNPGCTDPIACNYDSNADAEDGTCTYPGCTDATACNYDATAGCEDGTCTFDNCSGCELKIPLLPGWNIISSCCIPSSPNMEMIFAPNNVDTNIIQVKNLTALYVPNISFNTFPDWDVTQGYQVKVFDADTVVINGNGVVDVNTNSIPLNTGWNIIAYWLNGEAEPLTVFAPLAPDVIQVKNLYGVVSPAVPFDGMGNMEKTQGYQVKMAAPGALIYDNNDILPRVSGGTNDQLSVGPNGKAIPQHFIRKDAPHFNNAAFIILDPQNSDLHYGDEIGIFANDGSQDGILIGSMVYQNDNTGGLVYGNDEAIEGKTGIAIGEEYIIKLWDKALNQERIINTNELEFVHGNNKFEKDDLVIVNFKSAQANSTTTGIEDITTIKEATINAMPNPTSGEIVFDLQMPTAQEGVSIQIFSIDGKLMEEITNQERVIAGQHQLPYNVSHLPGGVYIYKLVVADKIIASNRFTVAK